MKVLIVDDEIVIRTGMANVLPWEEHGYDILEPAASGEEALERIKKERPDIIISDIKMQGMTGLELIDKINDLHYPKEVIVLSGFDEFDFVQEAIKQNVSDYLLKSSSPEEILQSVDKARDRLNETRRFLELEKSKHEDHIDSTLQRLLYQPITEEKLQQLQEQEPKLQGASFQLLIINRVVSNKRFLEAMEMWNSYLYGRWLIHSGKTLIVVKRNPNLSDQYLLQMAAKQVSDIFTEPVYVSKVFTHLNELSSAYAETKALFFYKWLLPDLMMIQAKDIKGREGISHLERYKEHEGELLEYIRYGDEVGLETWIRKFVTWAFAHPMATPKSIEDYIQNLFFGVVRYLDQMGNKPDKKVDIPTLDQYLSQPVKTLTKLFWSLTVNMKNSEKGAKKYVLEATRYIETHLSESITLQDVAGHVHVHPNYLSEIIRNITGKSYLELLTEKRMERAANILNHSNKQIGEISQLVGYNDRRYFTKVFKRYYNMTPTEYRNKMDNV